MPMRNVFAGALAFAAFAAGAPAARATVIFVVDGGAGDGSGGVIRVNTLTGGQAFVSTGNNFELPAGIAREARGFLLVSDYGRPGGPGRLIRVNPANGSQTVVSVGDPVFSGGSRFIAPSGIALGPSGQIYIADPDQPGDTGRIIRVDPVTGDQFTVSTGGSFIDPTGIVRDPASGALLAADVGDNGGTGSVALATPVTAAQ